jgi:regulator of RNase E activity RraA
VHPLAAKGKNMVGPAYTLRYIPAREDLNTLSVFENPEHPQRVAVESCPAGHVLIMDSRRDPGAASAGDILVTRMMKRGVAGVVTDGGFRDSPSITTLDIPAYHNRPSSPTNLLLHQAIELNCAIGCGGVPVFPGDVVVGDDEGVVIIPAEIADEVAAEAVEMTAFENFVSEKVHEGHSIVGLYPPTHPDTRPAFEEWRKNRGK